MFSRALRWLNNTTPDGDVSINLIHGKAQFNEEFQRLANTGIRQIFDPVDVDPARTGQVTAHWWLTGRKKSALADFVVATIDQVLLAALSAKHVLLRHLGLVGKVVILDEIHACDSYMQVYLTRALQWLGALGVPVVALSATLPSQIRFELLAAYERGRHFQDPNYVPQLTNAIGYPLISTTWAQPVACLASDRTRVTRVVQLDADLDICQTVLSACSSGGIVAVVHNTVRAAVLMTRTN